MPCAAKAPSPKKDLFMGSYFLFWYSCIRFARVWFFSSEKNETNKINKMCVHGRIEAAAPPSGGLQWMAC
jgi:hypothetical protein